MYAKIKINAALPNEKPDANTNSLLTSKRDGAGINQKRLKRSPDPTDNAGYPNIQCSLYYKVDVVKNSELYRRLSKSVKADLPITIKSSNPIYSHWVAMYGVLFEPSDEGDDEPVGRKTYLIDAASGIELLIDSLDQPDVELLTNLEQECLLFKQHGFDKDLLTERIETAGITYQIIDDSITNLNSCPNLSIGFRNVV